MTRPTAQRAFITWWIANEKKYSVLDVEGTENPIHMQGSGLKGDSNWVSQRWMAGERNQLKHNILGLQTPTTFRNIIPQTFSCEDETLHHDWGSSERLHSVNLASIILTFFWKICFLSEDRNAVFLPMQANFFNDTQIVRFTMFTKRYV